MVTDFWNTELVRMSYFHYRCGERITLLNDNCTAVRNDSDFDHGIVLSAEPLVNDIIFEIKIDKKVIINSFYGSYLFYLKVRRWLRGLEAWRSA